MSRNDNHAAGREPPGSKSDASDIQQAVERLERAVQELVASAKNHVSGRATAFLNDTASRIEREFRGSGGSEGEADDAHARMSARRRASRAREQRSRRLYRDPRHGKIVGVCAGIANYYGVESWVVRCIAVTGLLFFPSIVFPAYWIAYFVLPKQPQENGMSSSNRAERRNHTAPAPELGPSLSPRSSLRNVQADLTELELRLRRMETHVTSGQYELQRELHKIDEGRHAE